MRHRIPLSLLTLLMLLLLMGMAQGEGARSTATPAPKATQQVIRVEMRVTPTPKPDASPVPDNTPEVDGESEVIQLITPKPRLVDRVNRPRDHADFAFAPDAALLEIYFPQIINADAAILRSGGETVIIDTPDHQQAQRLVALVKHLGITRVDAVYQSHPHPDHTQGLYALRQVADIGAFYIAFDELTNPYMMESMAVCLKYGIPVKRIQDGHTFTIGSATAQVWLKGDESWGLNDQSAITRIAYGERTALFTGDAEFRLQKRLAEVVPPALMEVEFLKYPHHGVDKMGEEFAAATKPLFTVITGNQFRNKAALRQLRSLDIPFTTCQNKCVRVVTDGETWLMEPLLLPGGEVEENVPTTPPDEVIDQQQRDTIE